MGVVKNGKYYGDPVQAKPVNKVAPVEQPVDQPVEAPENRVAPDVEVETPAVEEAPVEVQSRPRRTRA